MKAGVWVAVMLCTAGLATAAEPAASPEGLLCRGAYPVLLMTEMECRLYAQQVRLLQTQGNTKALAVLKQQHDRLMAERATTCPCATQRTDDAPAIVVAGDC